MEKSSIRPDGSRMSVLIATILLVYAATQFIRQPINQIAIQLPGFFLPISINFRNIIWLGVAVLAIAGMDWLLVDYPALEPRQRVQHWLLPALTAWVIGVPLYSLPAGADWWMVYILGGILLTLVFWGEFYSVNPAANRVEVAVLGLAGLSYALFVVLTAGLRSSGTRLYLVVPAVVITAFLLTLRALYQTSDGRWLYGWSIAVGLLLGQVAIALHYLPFNAIQFGLLLVGMLYAAISLADRAVHKPLTRPDFIEPAGAIVIAVLLSVILG
jgi:hypothetical protein